MNIVDLTEAHQPLYFVCLEDWSEDMKEAGNHKAVWYEHMKERGLRVKLALDARGEVGGMIQYLPAAHAPIAGRDLYFIHCIWVHGHKQGRGNFQKQGMGKALLQAAEDDVRAQGAKGMAAWGISLPFWMKASWFKKQGYQKVDKDGMAVLLWKPFTADALPPKWIKAGKEPELTPGRVTVTTLCNGWCPVQNIVLERTRRAAAEFGDQVIWHEISTLDRDTFLEWGRTDAIFIDRKALHFGPPLSYQRIRKSLARRTRRL